MPDNKIRLNPAAKEITNGEITMRLGPSRYRIVESVMKQPGMNLRELVDAVYRDAEDGGPDNAEVTVRTQVWHLNKRIKKLGLQISSTRGPGAVYRPVYL